MIKELCAIDGGRHSLFHQGKVYEPIIYYDNDYYLREVPHGKFVRVTKKFLVQLIGEEIGLYHNDERG